MKWKALQPYYKIQREIKFGEQKTIVSNREMYLYENKIITRHREFPIHSVWDMSYRKVGNEGGILYLHTNAGLYPYMVREDPAPFINVFKKNKDFNK